MDRIVLCNNCQHSFLPNDTTSQFPFLSNLNDLLRSNQLPTCADTEQVWSYIAAEECELARCEQEMDHLYEALAQLHARRGAALERIERCCSWHSPIRRLPPELLEQIFGWICAPGFGGDSLDFFPPMYCHTAPTLALTHVSHHWRVIASASARLWSSIRLNLACNFSKVEVQESLLGHYLTRLKDHPLHLTELCYYGDQESLVSQFVAQVVPRITKLGLVEDKDPFSIYARFPKWLLDALHVAPRLHSVTISCFRLYSLKLPYPQLTVLEIVNIVDARRLVLILKRCTNLRSLHFATCRKRPIGTQSLDMQTHIKMPSLRQLSITVERSLDLSPLLRQLSLPSLSSFHIASSDDDAQAAQQQQGLSLIPVIDLIHRSECHLDEFRAEIRSGCIDIPHTDLQNFLALCPALSRLEVDVLRPSCEKMTPGTFLCQLLDVLSPANPDQTPIPSPELSYVIVSERWSTLNPERIDALLGRLEARIEVVKDYRARVPVPRWKWDLRFGALPECAPDALEGLKGRIEKLAKSGLKWAIVEPFKLVEPSTSGNDINASSWDYGDSSWDQGDSPHSGWVW